MRKLVQGLKRRSERQLKDGTSHAATTNATWALPTHSSTNSSLNPATPQLAIGNSGRLMHAPWTNLKTLIATLNASATSFGPLKRALNELFACIDLFERAARSREDYEGLQIELESLFDTLDTHFKGPMPLQMSASVVVLSNGISREIERVRNKCKRNRVERYTEATGDEEDVLNCYRRIHRLLTRISIHANLDMWKILDMQLAETRLDRMPISKAARYNSTGSTGLLRGGCTPNTRRQVIDGLHAWAGDPDGPNTYWLNGMAGTGKTAIAYSFCEEQKESLGASFFCSRSSASCSDATLIIPTIAYQLAIFSLPFRSLLCRLIGEELDICNRDITTQFQRMICETLTDMQDVFPEGTVIAIDALDECSDQRDVALLLAAILENAHRLPIKFFISSRAEGAIYSLMMREPKYRSVLYLHEIDESFVQEDIETYVTESLSPISPSAKQISQLVRQAGRLFIYAATVIQYVKSGGLEFDEYSSERLVEALELSARTSEVDGLYQAILSTAFDKSGLGQKQKEDMHCALCAVVCAQEPLTMGALGALLQPKTPQLLRAALQPFRSVLHISERTLLVTTLHVSFSDYLFDEERSGRFYCNQKKQHGVLARLCFERIRSVNPPFNICKLGSSHDFDNDIPDLSERVNKMIPLELSYASRYWATHLEHTGGEELKHLLLDFLRVRLLLWMEILNLEQIIGIGPWVVFQAERWCTAQSYSQDVISLIQDAYKFITVFANGPTSSSTPHIYISALLFWPSCAPISMSYLPYLRGLLKTTGTATARGSSALLAGWSVGVGVRCLAMSPSGTSFAIGSHDGILTVWDAHTGRKILGPLDGHTGLINSISYSPDGTQIASGSGDNTIRLWDACTGQLVLGPLEGHSAGVNSIAYSPDGEYIVSGSYDKTLRIWRGSIGYLVWNIELDTGAVLAVAYSPSGTFVACGCIDGTVQIWDTRTCQAISEPVRGHRRGTSSLAYSPDGLSIVSGSWDGTACLWDSSSGEILLGPVEWHRDAILQVVYSPDGTRIASCSADHAMYIWDVHTKERIAKPLEGHAFWVDAIAYSPDGARLISGSSDCTVCIWDARTGKEGLGLNEGHIGPITCVAYSPDGSQIVSGCTDKTVCIWDAATGCKVTGALSGHGGPVLSVAYSPDGFRIVTGSDDNTLRIWDAINGQQLMDPLTGHSKSVHSVTYFPNGTRIVSGSADHTLRIWDPNNGRLSMGPLEGHKGVVNSVRCSFDSILVFSGSEDFTIRLWCTSTGANVRVLDRHSASIRSLACSPDECYVVSGSNDGTVYISSSRDGGLEPDPIKGHISSVLAVAYSPDGTRIASGSLDGTIHVWDSRTGEMVGTPLGGHKSSIWSLAYAADGNRLVSSSADGTIRVWLTGGPVQEHDMIWELGYDGWVVNHLDQRLVWVPHDFRASLMMPGEVLHPYAHGSFNLDFEGVHLGSSWSRIWANS